MDWAIAERTGTGFDIPLMYPGLLNSEKTGRDSEKVVTASTSIDINKSINQLLQPPRKLRNRG